MMPLEQIPEISNLKPKAGKQVERKKHDGRISLWFVVAVLLLPLTGWGCATMSQPEPPVEPEFVRQTELAPQEMPPMKPLAEIKPRPAMEERMPFESQLFSLNIIEAELQEAVLPLAKVAGLNLVFDREVDLRAPITVSFSNLPLKKAMELILGSHGYYYQIEDNILRVKAMETRVFHLDYSMVSSTGSSDVSGDTFSVESEMEEDDVKIWEVVEEVLGIESSGGSGDSGEQSNETTSILSSVGQAQVNKMSGTIVVTDRPENIERLAHYLDELEKALRRQVLIEARLVEVTLNDGHQYGIDWSAVRTRLGRFGINSVTAGLGGAIDNTFSMDMGYTKNEDSFSAVLNALATSGNVNVLSAPRISVLNNQSAMINLTTELPYLQWEVRNVGSSDNPIYEPVPTIVFANEGIALGITPQISPDGMTTLLIVPRVANKKEDRSFNFRGDQFLVPVLTVRETSTLVRVPDGGTVVLGGIIEERQQDRTNKIPVLGDVPGLGRLFSNQVRATEKTELVIMVSATIIER
jgi:MSHA biogenesis protein MshL